MELNSKTPFLRGENDPSKFLSGDGSWNIPDLNKDWIYLKDFQIKTEISYPENIKELLLLLTPNSASTSIQGSYLMHIPLYNKKYQSQFRFTVTPYLYDNSMIIIDFGIVLYPNVNKIYICGVDDNNISQSYRTKGLKFQTNNIVVSGVSFKSCSIDLINENDFEEYFYKYYNNAFSLYYK